MLVGPADTKGKKRGRSFYGGGIVEAVLFVRTRFSRGYDHRTKNNDVGQEKSPRCNYYIYSWDIITNAYNIYMYDRCRPQPFHFLRICYSKLTTWMGRILQHIPNKHIQTTYI